ncbi:MAG TPA: TerC family protein [Methylovirgula sp.]|nr:TerC family protein [Methylovirgula sp.]
MKLDFANFIAPILEIIWIDVVLSGDNAVVIALACARLPQRQRSWGIILGTAAAIGLRAIFTLLFAETLGLPFVKLVGGLLLFWIAFRLARDDRSHKPVSPAASIFAAVRLIVIADAVMSLDNMVAVAAAAKGSILLILFGLALSIPLIIFGATLLVGLLSRFPILVWAGAALLGYIGGDLIGREFLGAPAPIGTSSFVHLPYFVTLCGFVGAIFVVLIAYVIPQREED